MKVCIKRVFTDASGLNLFENGHPAAAILLANPGQKVSESQLKDPDGDPFIGQDEFFIDEKDYKPPTLDQKRGQVVSSASIFKEGDTPEEHVKPVNLKGEAEKETPKEVEEKQEEKPQTKPAAKPGRK